MSGSARRNGGERLSGGAMALRALAVTAGLLLSAPVALAQTCSRDDFAAAVDDAAEALRALNQKNRPEFQERLRRLRDKNRWTHDQFMVAAAPFVKDPTIEDYEVRSEDALGRVTAMGQQGQQSKTPDCRLLAELKGHMSTLVEIQTAKWRYMFEKIDAALAK